MNRARWYEVAGTVRKMIADGALRPGDLTPSSASLAALTGVSAKTCRKALLIMARAGELTPSATRGGRPRVPGGDGPGPVELALSAALVAARGARGLTQVQLASAAGISAGTVRTAESGRIVRQVPATWAALDRATESGGKLVRMHAAWQALGAAPGWRP